MALDTGTEQATIERIGGFEGGSFGPPPIENVVPDYGNDDSGSLGSGEAGNSVDDGYERDATGGVIRNKDGSPRRKRGRKSGQSPGVRAKPRAGKEASGSSVLNVSGIEQILLSGFNMAAAVLSAPEWSIEKDEAHTIAEAVANVAQYYPLEVDPKTLAWCNLAMVAVPAIGARGYLTAQRLKVEMSQRSKPVGPQPNEAPAPATVPNPGTPQRPMGDNPPVQFPAFKP